MVQIENAAFLWWLLSENGFLPSAASTAGYQPGQQARVAGKTENISAL
jgi:hypothetical protein